MKIISAKNYNDLSRKAANILSAQVIMKPNAVLGLATGSTPIGTYEQLIEWYKNGDVDFSEVTTINLDEYVGLDGNHPQSYRHFMNEHFFDSINVVKENTFVPNGLAENREEECQRYNALIHKVGGIDIQLLGIGANAHIGFNEPGEAFETETHVVKLAEKTRLANARFFGSITEVPTHALTMGIKNIMLAKKIVLLATGEGKAQALYDSMFGPVRPEVPASILQLHNDLTVIADEAALTVVRSKR